MTRRKDLLIPLLLGVLVAVVVGVIAISAFNGPEERAHIRLVEPNGLGLRAGNGVRLGGVLVGKVEELSLTKNDDVQVDITITDDAVRLGRNASVAVKSLNLLGEKYVALDPGDVTGTPQDNVTIPSERITTPTDLDQVLDVLDADTRTRLAILVNEAGVAMTGRDADFNALLEKLPSTLTKATGLLEDVTADNAALAELIGHSDSFLARAVREEDGLKRFVDSTAGAAQTFAERQDDLRATLAKAPAGLATLRGFLADLRTTAPPLGAAARNISATAPELARTLAAVEPFGDAIRPTLRTATDVAPTLTELGREATPVINRAQPTLRALDRFATAAIRFSKTLGVATPDVLGVLEGWGRAIQGRDSRGHVFHGSVTFGPGILSSIFQTPEEARSKRRGGGRPVPATAPAAPPASSTPGGGPVQLPKLPLVDLNKTVQDVQQLTDGLLGTLGVDGDAQTAKPLLDYLLKP